MDDFVCNKLKDWGLSDWIGRFKDEDIDKEALECLDVQAMNHLIPKVGPRAKFKRGLKLLKAEACTRNSSHKRKRKLVLQEEFSEMQSPRKKRGSVGSCSVSGPKTCTAETSLGSSLKDQVVRTFQNNALENNNKIKEETVILYNVKNIMRLVYGKLHLEDNTKLNAFLKKKISDLEIDKRELVGVFGKTGAGKSSLINAIIGEFDLLPSGTVKACTSVMIKVEANMCNSNYEAEIEFITEEEWKDELWSLCTILKSNKKKDEDEDYQDIVNKLSALYGKEWRNKSPKNLMDEKYFREIPEFLHNTKKKLTYGSSKELSAKIVKYTRSDSSEGEGRRVRRWYWPLVKCVTVRVPNVPLLQHVTLVDLPGCGDRNKSRDKMWKEIVGSCSTVWIVTEINRAASEKEPWEILESACSLIGNAGQCQQIHFICTKSDLYENWNDLSATAFRDHILKRNMTAKVEVQREFNKLNNIKKHFSNDCLKVFTVSSKEFLKIKKSKPTYLQLDQTEIPKLQEFLNNLNNCHSETLNYVSGAYGILSLMEGARCRDVAESTTDVCLQLEISLRKELQRIRKSMEKTYTAFEQCLNEGVQKSIDTCATKLRSVLFPKPKNNGFHGTLKSTVVKGGVHKPLNGELINLNATLSSSLTNSIDGEFRKTFPNDGKCEPFNGVISAFSLNTDRLIKKYKDVELQLIFLKTEEEQIKAKLNRIIRERKKTVYSSLTDTVEEAMQDGYKRAAQFTQKGMLDNIRETLQKHVHNIKTTTFEEAKNKMLGHQKNLQEEIWKSLGKTLSEGIELSLKTDEHSIPDLSKELDLVKKHYNQLEGRQLTNKK